jgi:hypothetical protein
MAGQVVLLDFEVRDLEAADGLDRQLDRLIGRRRPSRSAQASLCIPKRPQNLGPIEPLSLAVVAEAHMSPDISLQILLCAPTTCTRGSVVSGGC